MMSNALITESMTALSEDSRKFLRFLKLKWRKAQFTIHWRGCLRTELRIYYESEAQL
jgi:hypothetical protein